MRAPTYPQVARIANPLMAVNSILCWAGVSFTITAGDFLARQELPHRLVFTLWWMPLSLVSIVLSLIMIQWSKRLLVAELHRLRDDFLAQGHISMAKRVEADIALFTRKRRRR